MNNKLTPALFFVFIFSLSFVFAQGLSIPNQFYGTATYNGAASENIKVEAYYIDSVIKTTFSITEGLYNLKVEDPNEFEESETINFYLNGVNTGQTAVFENGVSTKLDLAAVGATTTPPASSGGGGGSSSSSTTTTQTNDNAVSLSFETQDNEEESKEEITTYEQIEQQGNFISGITGAVIGLGNKLGKLKSILVIVFIIGIIGVFVFVKVRKKSEK